MPKLTTRLTDLAVAQLPEGREKGDAGSGLYIRKRNGRAEWFIRPVVGGRQRRQQIGLYPALGLAEARVEAAKALAQIAKDEAAGEAEATGEETVAALWAKYRAARIDGLATRTRDEYDRQWVKYIEPKLGRKRVRAITTREVSSLLHDLRDNARAKARAGANGVIATRVHSLLRTLFDYGVSRGWITVNPAAGASTGENRRRRSDGRTARATLSDTDRGGVVALKDLWAAILKARLDSATRGALTVALLLGTRAEETVLLTSKDVAWKKGEVTIRKGKGGKARTLPFGPHLRTVLLEAKARAEAKAAEAREAGEEIDAAQLPLFPVRRDSLGQAMGRLGLGLTAHDLRRTAATAWSALGGSTEAIKLLLGHAMSSDVTNIYNRDDRMAERRQLIEAWEAKVLETQPRDTDTGTDTNNVVPLRATV